MESIRLSELHQNEALQNRLMLQLCNCKNDLHELKELMLTWRDETCAIPTNDRRSYIDTLIADVTLSIKVVSKVQRSVMVLL